MQDQPDLSALIASRICHDLISPIGAISNGVELLAMDRSGPELELLAESAANANARIRFFRIGFGAAMPDQRIARSEVIQVLAELSRGGRIGFDWTSAPDLPRNQVRLVFLLLQCLESALAYGGKISVGETDGQWQIRAEAARLRHDPAIWAVLTGAAPPLGLAAAQVQFPLAAREVARLGRVLAVMIGAMDIDLKF